MRLIICFCLAVAVASPVAAADGFVQTRAYKELPPNQVIDVQPWDNSAQNLKIAEKIKQELKVLGLTVGAPAALLLSFEVKDQPGHFAVSRERHILELQAQSGDKDSDDAKVRLNLFSSETGGVFGNRASNDRVVRSKYAIEATLDAEGVGRIWQGSAWSSLEGGSPERLIESLVPLLLENFGKTSKKHYSLN